MAMFCFKHAPGKPLTAITLTVGEEAQPIVWTGSPGDADVATALADPPNEVAQAEDLGPFGDPRATARTFRISGMSQGTADLVMWRVASPPQRVGSLRITVRDPDDRDADLLYRGRHLVWFRSLPSAVRPPRPLVFAATSGLTGYQLAKLQTWKDVGPTPEHVYTFLAGLDPAQGSVGQANARHARATSLRVPPYDPAFDHQEAGLQFLPLEASGAPVSSAWGTMRVRLFPVVLPSGRGGFFLHNSRKQFSHGCIEVGRARDGRDFFETLLAYARAEGRGRTLRLKVKYSYPEMETRGDTFR
jgi:hypothetical protein